MQPTKIKFNHGNNHNHYISIQPTPTHQTQTNNIPTSVKTTYIQPSPLQKQLPDHIPIHGRIQNKNRLPLQPGSQISFGNNYRTGSPEPTRIAFTQSQFNPPVRTVEIISNSAQDQSLKRPELIENPLKLLREAKPITHQKGEVKGFYVDTTEVKTIKQNQFIGCFHCFSPVTYSASSHHNE